MTEVKFAMSVPALDALRRTMRRDFQADQLENARVLTLPEGDRREPLLRLMRNQSDRELVERTLGFDSARDEIGSK